MDVLNQYQAKNKIGVADLTETWFIQEKLRGERIKTFFKKDICKVKTLLDDRSISNFVLYKEWGQKNIDHY